MSAKVNALKGQCPKAAKSAKDHAAAKLNAQARKAQQNLGGLKGQWQNVAMPANPSQVVSKFGG